MLIQGIWSLNIWTYGKDVENVQIITVGERPDVQYRKEKFEAYPNDVRLFPLLTRILPEV